MKFTLAHGGKSVARTFLMRFCLAFLPALVGIETEKFNLNWRLFYLLFLLDFLFYFSIFFFFLLYFNNNTVSHCIRYTTNTKRKA